VKAARRLVSGWKGRRAPTEIRFVIGGAASLLPDLHRHYRLVARPGRHAQEVAPKVRGGKPQIHRGTLAPSDHGRRPSVQGLFGTLRRAPTLLDLKT